MGSTFFSLHYHVVFSTKQRRPFIRPAWRAQLHAYLGGTTHGFEGVPECVGGVDDHVHAIVSLKTKVSFMDELIRLFETNGVRYDPKYLE
jgi:REP element-mobilizing transposase RayT